VILQAYVDESWNDDVFAMGGYIATTEQWEQLSDDWAAELNRHPKLDYFKMSEAGALRGPFQFFTTEQRDQRLENFYSIVEKNVLASFSSVVFRRDFETLVKKLPVKLTTFPYRFMLNSLLTGVAAFQKRGGLNEPVKYIFDRQMMQEKKVLGLWDVAMNDMWPENRAMIAGPPIFEDEKDFEGLQAADLEAWWARRRADEKVKGLERLEYPWQPTRADFPDIIGWWGYENLRKHFAHRAKVLGYGDIEL
jgi:hypothetical protein